MNAYVVYMDILLLLNFCMDFMLIWAAGRFLRRRAGLPRLLLAAALGAVYGAGIVFPSLGMLYFPPAVVLVSLLLLCVAYPFQSAGAFLRLAGVFYIIAFAMAGAVLAGATLLQNSGFTLGAADTMRVGTLLVAIPVALIIARRGYAALKRGWNKENFQAEAELWLGGRFCRLTALIDTGNDLREPLSGKPVLVVDYEAVKTLLPEKLRSAYRRYGDDAAQLLQYLEPDLNGGMRRLRLIPFASIGKRNGMLLGFSPERLRLFYAGRSREIDAVVAIVPHGLGAKQSYQAVVNPEVLDAVIEKKEVSA